MKTNDEGTSHRNIPESKFHSSLSLLPISKMSLLEGERTVKLALLSQGLPWAYEEKAKNYLGFSFLALSSVPFTLA